MPPLGDASAGAILYDRVVGVTRPSETYPTTGRAQVGSSPVVGATAIKASIQMARGINTGLPVDDTTARRWLVYLDPTFTTALLANDVVTDDLGRQFKVTGAYPGPLGTKLECQDWATGGSHGN